MDAKRLGSLVACSLLLLTIGCQKAQILTPQNCSGQAIPQSYLVKWNGQVPKEYEGYRLHPHSLVTRFTGITEEALKNSVLEKHSNDYLFAERDYMLEVQQTVRAPVGPTGDVAGSSTWGPPDIEASQAWSYLGENGSGVIVAVVDSGVDANHPLLSGQITQGESFVGEPTDISDGVGHGTHVSGIIAGLQDTTAGFTGVAPGAKIMPLKFINSSGAGAVSDAISATGYAVANGAKVINASWGGSECSASLQQEIVAATQSGTVFVTAAGNDSDNISQVPEYPAVYQAPGKITVAAYNYGGALAPFSNFGTLVDLAAPGGDILSTYPPQMGQTEGQMFIDSGTSMAAPFVSAVAALLFAKNPQATPTQVANAITAGVVPGNYGVRSGGRLDALLAAQYFMSH